MAKVAVIVFPGSNCDKDAHFAFSKTFGFDVTLHWHTQEITQGYDLVVLPGGFSYGDYLRAGALAKVSPSVLSLQSYIEKGGFVLGICNGFQILTECGYLPGALSINEDSLFHCEDVFVKVENTSSGFTKTLDSDRTYRLPIAHKEGRYIVDDSTYQKMVSQGQIALRYVDAKGEMTKNANVNGSTHSIAGVFNEAKNVLGMMPHPERVTESIQGNTDGKDFLDSICRVIKKNG